MQDEDEESGTGTKSLNNSAFRSLTLGLFPHLDHTERISPCNAHLIRYGPTIRLNPAARALDVMAPSTGSSSQIAYTEGLEAYRAASYETSVDLFTQVRPRFVSCHASSRWNSRVSRSGDPARTLEPKVLRREGKRTRQTRTVATRVTRREGRHQTRTDFIKGTLFLLSLTSSAPVLIYSNSRVT